MRKPKASIRGLEGVEIVRRSFLEDPGERKALMHGTRLSLSDDCSVSKLIAKDYMEVLML